MRTWQDLESIGDNENARRSFVMTATNEHAAAASTREAADAELYYEGQNPTISRVNKVIVDAYGRKIPDIWSPNHKIKSQLYPYFVNQEVLTLLGNGISFAKDDTLKKLGKGFEKKVTDATRAAINGGAAFGFWNLDHLDIFSLTEFAPLYDEETGRLMAGIRYWQLSEDKPKRYVLFEPDGITEYIKRGDEDMKVLSQKKAYVQRVSISATGTEVAPGEPLPGLPIIPLYNVNKRSAISGSRDTLDAYDLLASKVVNNIDNGEFIYWIVKNAPYMADDPEELQAFLQRLKTSGVVAVGDGQEIESHRVDIPFEATDAGLTFLRKQLFSDFMAFDPTEVASGATTATQIKAAYEPLNTKLDLLEYQVTEFIEGILEVAGIDDTPTYTRSLIINKQEEAQTVIAAAEYTGEEYTTRKLLEIMGDADKSEEILARQDAEAMGRFSGDVNEG